MPNYPFPSWLNDDEIAHGLSMATKLASLGIDMDIDEEAVFAPREAPDPSAFSLGDRLALADWVAAQPKKELTEEQHGLLLQCDKFIERLSLHKESAPKKGAICVTTPEGKSWR